MEQIELIILPLIIGYVLDLIFGDPRNCPHPIVGFGNMINLGTKKLNHGKHRLAKGAFMSLSLILLIYPSFHFLSMVLLGGEKWAFIAFNPGFGILGAGQSQLTARRDRSL